LILKGWKGVKTLATCATFYALTASAKNKKNGYRISEYPFFYHKNLASIKPKN